MLAEIHKAVTRVNRMLAPFEQVRKYRVLARDFSIEHGRTDRHHEDPAHARHGEFQGAHRGVVRGAGMTRPEGAGDNAETERSLRCTVF